MFVYGLLAVFLMLKKLTDLKIDMSGVIIILAVLSFLGFLFMVISFNDKASGIIVKLLKSIENKKFWNKISPKIQKLIFSYQSYRKKKTVLLVFFILTLAEIFTEIFIKFFNSYGIKSFRSYYIFCCIHSNYDGSCKNPDFFRRFRDR